jgi:hypothetical protein
VVDGGLGVEVVEVEGRGGVGEAAGLELLDDVTMELLDEAVGVVDEVVEDVLVGNIVLDVDVVTGSATPLTGPDEALSDFIPHASETMESQASLVFSVFCITDPQRSLPIILPGTPHFDWHLCTQSEVLRYFAEQAGPARPPERREKMTALESKEAAKLGRVMTIKRREPKECVERERDEARPRESAGK